jgi:hypothetical protein
MEGGYGDDLYGWIGDSPDSNGHDTIFDIGGYDVLRLKSGISFDDLFFERNGDDLLIDHMGNGAQTINIIDQFLSDAIGIEALIFPGNHLIDINDITYVDNSVSNVPEPSTILLLAAGFAGLGLVRAKNL